MQSAAQVAPVAPLNAQPVLERLTDGLFPRAEALTDQIHKLVESLLQSMQVDALVLKSGSHVQPCWVKVVCWLPVEGRQVTERVGATIAVEPRPFHRFELVYNVSWDRGGRTKSFPELRQFTQNDVTALVQFLITGQNEPNFKPIQLRQNRYQFWKPVNKVNAVDTDWLAVLPGILLVLGIFTLALVIGFVLILAAVVLLVVLKKRTRTVRSGGKPLFEPRTLQTVDAWQTVVSGAGVDAEIIRRRFLDAIANPPSPHFRSTIERIWYWGLDNKEEREQIVLSFNRAIFFAQIYQYGRELYVGWDSHLNRGAWAEKTIASGIDRQTRRPVHINTVVPGSQTLTEYDVSDASCLTEWAHAQLVRIIKAYMEERRIDQEIDFKIIRGQRQGMTGSEAAQPNQATGFIKRLRDAAKA